MVSLLGLFSSCNNFDMQNKVVGEGRVRADGDLMHLQTAGNIRVATVRESIWKMNFFPGQGKVGEFCGLPGKFRKELESQ